MREPIRSYLYSLYISWRTGNMDGFRPKILAYHRNVIRIGKGARLIVGKRLHLSTRPTAWPGGCFIELGANSTIHFTGYASIRAEVRIETTENAKITIGDRCIVRERARINANQEITLGDRTGIGNSTMISDGDFHPIIENGKVQQMTAPVHIGDHIWVGAHCIILKGVTIGNDTMIGAGSLVTKDIPDHVVAFGRPAKPHHSIDSCFRN
ncbi:MAG: acyltransferase [Sedimentisphaerales bacterium]|nr:acyltransferase [Sedimentisphaerales bacterium]